ncbi:hypothetical protein E4U54_006364, partial [Claviceps lovelessii]
YSQLRGRVSRDKASGKRKIVCRNWECGVVVPVRTAPSPEQKSLADMGRFAGTIPIPMQLPGREYSPDEEPWFFQSI